MRNFRASEWKSLLLHSERSRKCQLAKQCGNSSVGRAQPCQGWGREFEPRFPLKGKDSNCYLFLYQLLERGRSAGW